MAYKNKTIYNDITRNSIKFLQTSSNTFGRLLEMETTYSAHSKEPPAHYHPYQSEEFTILSGELSARINGKLNVLTEGQKLYIPSNTLHSIWNNSDTRTVVNRKVEPDWILNVNTSWKIGKVSQLENKLLVELRNFVFRITPSSVSEKQLEKIYNVDF